MDNDNMSILRQNLAFLMDTHQMSANALAQASGASQPTISRILSGDSTDPRVQSIQPIADYFKVDVEDLRGKLLDGADSIQLLGAVAPKRKHIPTVTLTTTISYSKTDAAKHVEREILDLLPDSLKQHFRAKDQMLPGMLPAHFSCDYISARLLFDLKVLTFRNAEGRQSFGMTPFSGVIESLWHIASLRLLHKDHFPQRRHILFVVFVDEKTGQPSNLVAPPTVFHTLQAEAALHGVALVQSTPALIASTVIEAEGL